MPSNTTLNTGSGGDVITTKQRTHDGDTTLQQMVGLSGVTGTEDAYTFTDIQAGDGTEANALRVTIASDSSALSVDDGGGSLTVDGTVAVTGVATAANQLPDGHNVTVDNASGAAAVNIQDGGNSITVDDGAGSLTVDNAGTFAVQVDGAALTALQTIDNSVLADDAAFTLASSSVNMAGAVRDDALSTLTAVEGDAVPLRVSATGALHVTGGGGGTEYNEDAATPATITGTATMMERDDALSALTPIEGDWAAMRCDSQGALWVNVVNADGTSNVDTASGGTDSGAVMLAVRDDALTTLTPADGDYTTLRVNSTGALHVTGAGGGTQYNIDDAVGATDTVTMAGVVRDDSLTTLTEADGDVSVLRVNSTGALHVTGGGGGTEYVVNAAVPADPTGTASLMERDDALSALTEIEGDWTNMRSNANGALWTAVDGTVTVDGSGVTQPVSGTVTANLSATDNAVLDQIEVNTSYGDNTGNGTATGALRVTVASDTTGVLSVDDNGGSLTVDNAGTFATQVDGAALTALQLIDNPIVAHDAAASGSTGVNMAGGYATNSIEGLTQVANADAARMVTDLNGVQVVRPHTTPEEHISERISNTNGTSTAFTNFAAGGAGVHNYVCDVTITNTSATDGYVDLRDGTAGAIIWTFPAPANSGATHSFSLPLKGAANTALAYDVSAALTTVFIAVNGFQAQG